MNPNLDPKARGEIYLQVWKDAPLVAAVNNGSLDVVRYLLSFGPDVSKHLHHAEEGTLVHVLLLDSCGKGKCPDLHRTDSLIRLVMSYY